LDWPKAVGAREAQHQITSPVRESRTSIPQGVGNVRRTVEANSEAIKRYRHTKPAGFSQTATVRHCVARSKSHLHAREGPPRTSRGSHFLGDGLQ
jgi:hypothetical protein